MSINVDWNWNMAVAILTPIFIGGAILYCMHRDGLYRKDISKKQNKASDGDRKIVFTIEGTLQEFHNALKIALISESRTASDYSVIDVKDNGNDSIEYCAHWDLDIVVLRMCSIMQRHNNA